jgi:hypothetical protein
MNMAIAAEVQKHPSRKGDYKIWYLKINRDGNVYGIGVMTKDELLKDLFSCQAKNGESHWRAFLKDQEQSVPVELIDFIAINDFENTHFGNLPTLCEFQETLNCLSYNFELRSIA